MSFYLRATQLVASVGSCDKSFADDFLAAPADSHDSFRRFFDYLEHEHNIEEAAADDVRVCVQSFLRDLFSRVLGILNACEAAIVIVVVSVQCSGISAESKREPVRIQLELLWCLVVALSVPWVCLGWPLFHLF